MREEETGQGGDRECDHDKGGEEEGKEDDELRDKVAQ